MFIISIFGKKQLFLNSKTDDFIRLLPEQFDCEESDIESEYIDEADQKAIRREMKMNPENDFIFDLESKKLLKIGRPKFKPGDKNPNHILNRTAKPDNEPASSSLAIEFSEYQSKTHDEKIEYLKSIDWVPRIWEQFEYQGLIGTKGADLMFNADSPECKQSIEIALTFKTHKVKKINYTPTVNSLTGEVGMKVDSMEFEE